MKTPLLLFALPLVLAPAAASAQAVPPSNLATVLQTRAIEAQVKAAGAVTVPSTASRSGTLVAKFSITIASNIPTSQTISCVLTATHPGTLSGAVYTETAQVDAVRSGSKATCTVTLPYLWSLADPAGWVIPQISVMADRRQLVHSLPMFAVPAEAATKTLTPVLRF